MDQAIQVNFAYLWTWVLMFVRCIAILSALPGIGTEQVPSRFRGFPAIILAFCFTFGGPVAKLPAGLAEGGLMIFSEYLLGYLLGAIPAYTLAAGSVAGTAVAGAIGLSQASMIDQSLGESTTVIAKLNTLIAGLVFLLLDGHHLVFRASAAASEIAGIGTFLPDLSVSALLLHRFVDMFSLAVLIAAPILVASLFTQFVLGLLTKFVPQINVFIMSMPLNILVGMFILHATLPELIGHITNDFNKLDEVLYQLYRQ